VALFSVTDRGRFLGHLDRVEAFRRAVRRAGGRLALSAVIRPKALLSLALPLGVGIEGLNELCEFELADEPEEGFAERLSAALPGHMRLLELQPYHAGRRLAARVTGASYEVDFVAGLIDKETGAPGTDEKAVSTRLTAGAMRFADAQEWVVEETREDRVRAVDVKRYVRQVEVSRGARGSWTARFAAAVTPAGSARPEVVLKALQQASGLDLVPVSVRRTQIRIE
jgi:radical SAM-linked protein